METDYEIGQTLIVELENEMLIGELKQISTDGRMVELINVREFNTGFVYTSSQCLPRPLIKSIKTFKTGSPTKTTNPAPCSSKVQLPAEITDLVNITSSEIDQIQRLVSVAKYIFQTDQNYHKAIDHIKQEDVISLYVEPTQFGRNNRPSLLSVATSQNVYIFDLISLGNIFKGLRDVLQSQRPKKIVYYSNKIVDNLKYRHEVKLVAIFDIYVAHCLISKEKTPVSLKQCVRKYFGIAENYFEEEFVQEGDIYKRPLQRSYLDVVAKKVVFLYKLYQLMLHDIILKNFYKQCNDFSTVFAKNKDDVEVVMQMKPNTVHGTDCIGDEDWVDQIEQELTLSSFLDDYDG